MGARLGAPARHLGTVGSTMTEAAAWAADGAPHGAVVTAEHQTAGRGRHGRAWTAAPGESLLFTVVLRPSLAPSQLGLVALAAGLGVAEAVSEWGVGARVKWPNDVRVGGRKLAGVLAEARHGPGGPVVLLGVGLNVRQSGFPGGLAATSVWLETGDAVAPRALLSPALAAVGRQLDAAHDAPARLVAAVEAHMEGLGQAMTVRDPATGAALASGRALGLAEDGALRLATAAGEQAVYAGETTLS